jgi:hypothetical protein
MTAFSSQETKILTIPSLLKLRFLKHCQYSIAFFYRFSYTFLKLINISEGNCMTRPSKQEQRRMICPRKLKPSFAKKTGPKKDNLSHGFKPHENSIQSNQVFIAKVK